MKHLLPAFAAALTITVGIMSALLGKAHEERDQARAAFSDLQAADEKLKAADRDLQLSCGRLQQESEAAHELLAQALPFLAACALRSPHGRIVIPLPRPRPRPSEDVCPFNSPIPCASFSVPSR